MQLRILIVDGTPAAVQDRLALHGVVRVAENYRTALVSQLPDGVDNAEFGVLPGGDGLGLPKGDALANYHAVVWTGSPFGAYEQRIEVIRQIGLARTVFQSGIPSFGSCWGLQVVATALGGRVHLHPKGRELCIARKIMLTDAGRDHPMYGGKSSGFDALCIHKDEVCELPPGTRVLAGNRHSQVQAVDVTDGNRTFWGVQYHPEFDLRQVAGYLRALNDRFVGEGFAATPAVMETIAADLATLDRDPHRQDLAWKYGIDADILDVRRRGREFANWLRLIVLPRCRNEVRSQ